MSLREVYQFAGRRLSKYNDPLLEPHRVYMVQNLLVFWAENQYVETWGVSEQHFNEEDPPVYVDLSGCDAEIGGPSQLVWQNPTLSEFVFQTVLWDYMRWGPAMATARGYDEVESLLPDCELIGLPDWVRGEGRSNCRYQFWGNSDEFMLVTSGCYARRVPRRSDDFLRHCTKRR